MIIHGSGDAICWTDRYSVPVFQAVSGPDGKALPTVHPEHGTVVECHQCRRLGILPAEGHVLDFLPGASLSEDGKSIVLRFS